MFQASALSDLDTPSGGGQRHARRTPPLGTHEREPAGKTRVFDYPGFDRASHKERLDKLSDIANRAAEDPRLRRLCVDIFKKAGVPSRDYEGQVTAIFNFIRDNVFFLHEKDEVLQDPLYTLDIQEDGSVGPKAHGDCDDFTTLFIAMCRTCHLPAEPVISGSKNGKKVRFIRTQKDPKARGYTHAYSVVGMHPFNHKKYDSTWKFADPTVPGVPLGWDCVGFGLSDPDRTSGALAGTDSEENVGSLSGKTFLQLVGVSIASTFIVDAVRVLWRR